MKRALFGNSLRAVYPLTLLACAVVTIQSPIAQAQQPAALHVGEHTASASQPRSESVDTATELEREVARGTSFTIRFRRTRLDDRVEATAQVVVRGQTLLVRVRATNLPQPERWHEQRYSLWVYLSNYEQKLYIGDLPLLPLSQGRAGKGELAKRGEADSVFRFPSLPPGATFGGLILTAEPARFTPIVNEPLRPLLLALLPEEGVELGPLRNKATRVVAPRYPLGALSNGIAGSVTVYLVVDETGAVAKIVRVSGDPLLGRVAAAAAKQWKFRPTSIGGLAVRATGYISFKFTL